MIVMYRNHHWSQSIVTIEEITNCNLICQKSIVKIIESAIQRNRVTKITIMICIVIVDTNYIYIKKADTMKFGSIVSPTHLSIFAIYGR